MKKSLLVISIIIFSSFCAFSETELENLWLKAKKHSVDLQSAKYSLGYAESSLKYKRSLYPLSLSSSVNSSFNDTYENLAWYTTSSTASVNVSKKNPFGNSVSAGISYSINRGILNYSAKDIDSDNIGYSQNPSVNLSINQSLMPAFDAGIKDPNTEILRKNIRSASFTKDSAEKQLIEDVTYYYIQARCNARLLEKYKQYVAFYDLKIESAKELLGKSKISSSELWKVENKKWEYYQDYIEVLNSKESINMNLRNLCGESSGDSTTESVLPESGIELFPYNPSKENIANEIEILKLKNVLNRQDTAPFLTIGGTFSEATKTNKDFHINYIEEKNYFNWTFSLGVTFSEFFSPSKKLEKQLYKNNLSIYGEKLKNITEETENRKKNYEEIITLYERQLQHVLKLYENRIHLEKDYDQLFKDGKCSQIEMKEIQLNTLESECIYKNLNDNLWFYKWKRNQCK